MTEILNLPLPRGYEPHTVGSYLLTLLSQLWKKGEKFDLEKPLGSWSWEYPVYRALIEGGVVEGYVDELTEILMFKKKNGLNSAKKLVIEAIRGIYLGG